MIFQPRFIPLIRSGRKTQTRRLALPEDEAIAAPDGAIQAIVRRTRTGNRRQKYRVGAAYAIQPGRGLRATDYLRLRTIRQERGQDITPADVRAEGLPDRAAFAELWDRLHPRRGERWADNPPVYVLSFDYGWLVPTDNHQESEDE